MMDVRIPLFPLHTVLFPGQVLPLHIFEPRYRAMIAECLRAGRPFGVVLIKTGREVGEAAVPAAVGTTARIAQVATLPDGRMDILTVGESRFRIHQVHTERSYMEATATISRWPDEQADDLQPLAANVLALLGDFIEDQSTAENRDALEQLPKSPLLVATAAAAVPSIPLYERQRLLELPTLRDVLVRETALLMQERALLRVLQSAEPPRRDPDNPFSVN
jgi:Lon protease-like protein